MKDHDSTRKNTKRQKIKAEEPRLELYVAPQNSKGSREVVAKVGDLVFHDTLNTNRASARDKFFKSMKETLNYTDADGLKAAEQELYKKAQEVDSQAEQAARDEAADVESSVATDPSDRALEETPRGVKSKAKAWLKSPDLMEELAADLEIIGIVGEKNLALTLYLTGTSRLLERPLSGTVKASSSSGKSHVTEGVTSLMPEECVITATNITAQALYYMPLGSLRHMFVVVGERLHSGGDDADTANATLALRELMSRGRLDKLVPVQSPEGGMITRHIVQEGPIAYLDTTTQQQIFEEDATRMLPLATDESVAQTRDIMSMQAEKAKWAGPSPADQEAVRQKHRTAQRLLKQRRVRIPFADKLILSASSLIARRAFPQLLGVIEAVALLRQFRKKHHDDGHIVATVEDYRIAYGLMRPILQRTFAPVGERALGLMATISNQDLVPQQRFTRADCQKWTGLSATEIRNRINVLVEAGLIEILSGNRGSKYSYCVTGAREAEGQGPVGLITPEELKAVLKTKSTKSGSAPGEKVSPKRKPLKPRRKR
jgi:hypothetical protein